MTPQAMLNVQKVIATSSVRAVLGIVTTVLGGYALFLLFGKSGRVWFQREKVVEDS